MARVEISNGDSGLVVRNGINDNFQELYANINGSKKFFSEYEKAIAKHKFGYVGAVSSLSSANNTITILSHGLSEDNAIFFNGTSNGITAYKRYYVGYVDVNTIKLKESTEASGFVDITSETAGQVVYQTNDNYFLLIGDSNIEGAGVLVEDNAMVNQLLKDVQDRQYGVSIMENLRFPSEGNETYFIETGTWLDVQNEYSSVGQNMTGVESASLAARGWYKTSTNGDSLKIYTKGFDIRILVASDGVFAGEIAGSVTVSVYNGSDVLQHSETFDCSGSSYYKWIYPDMSDNADGYYILLTADLGASEYLAVQCVMYIYNIFNRGLKVANLGTSSSRADHWAIRTNIIDAFQPVCSLIGLGGNDIAALNSSDDYESNMTTLLDKLTSYGDVIMIFYSPWVTTDQDILDKIEEYREVLKTLVLEYNNVYFIDFHDILVDGATMNSDGLLSDTVHANDKGHEFMYNYLKQQVNLP